jgi:hypothetical protein
MNLKRRLDYVKMDKDAKLSLDIGGFINAILKVVITVLPGNIDDAHFISNPCKLSLGNHGVSY